MAVIAVSDSYPRRVLQEALERAQRNLTWARETVEADRLALESNLQRVEELEKQVRELHEALNPTTFGASSA